MKEILKNQVNKYEWNEYYQRMDVVSTYHIFYNEEQKTIYLDAPLEVKVLWRIRRVLAYNGIEYNNIIID